MVTDNRECCGGRVDWRAGQNFNNKIVIWKRGFESLVAHGFFSQHNEGIRNKLEAGFVDFNLCYN